MNKPLVAAITGVAFGVTLTGAIMFARNHTRSRGCHRAVVHHAYVPPSAVPAPQYVHPHFERNDRYDSACPRLVDSPLDVDSQLSEAQTEYVNGNYGCAMQMARLVAEESPVRAHRIIAAAACQTKDLATLKQVERRLDAPSRQYTLYVCQRSGITRTKHGWRLEE
jgi:hypothetical protein